MTLSRRAFLLSGVASGALLLGRPTGVLSSLLGTAGAAEAASRTSKLFPGSGLSLVHADLHNHTLLSDGDGDAANAFASMRSWGLDVAAITDHATTGKLGANCGACGEVSGIDEAEWQRLQALADAENHDGFVAMRGFEWSSPQLGHMNVWMSATWTDPLTCGAVDAESVGAFFLHEGGEQVPPSLSTPLNSVLRTSPTAGVSMTGFYDWLAADPSRPVLGGGSDGIAGFNHPGREAGRFGFFKYDARLANRVVSMELFNRGEDYLFEQVPTAPSPMVECLDKGWKVGFTGVTDEHGTNWGQPDGKGRTGLWIRGDLNRASVREAMLARRFFCTREKGLRLDASMQGVQMGGRVAHTNGVASFAVDIDKGTSWQGETVRVQVLQTGRPLPTIVHELDVAVPADGDPAITFSCPISRANGEWVVVRITDPALGGDGRAAGTAFASAGRAIAYASPFFLS